MRALKQPAGASSSAGTAVDTGGSGGHGSLQAMQLIGIHHLRPYNLADARRNHDFHTRTLGMRLVKKTVNQDDTEADAAGASPFWHLANVNRR